MLSKKCNQDGTFGHNMSFESVSFKPIWTSKPIAKLCCVRCPRGADIDTSSSRYLDKLLGGTQVHFSIPLKLQAAR